MIKNALTYFFSKGSDAEFSIFTVAHLMPILLMVAAIYLLHRSRGRIRASAHETDFRYILGFLLIVCDMSYYWRLSACPWLSEGPTAELPIGVCTWAIICSSFMLIGKSQKLFDIVYFWLFSGTLFALITPTPLTYTGPTRFRYYQFWLEHTLGYIAVFYMIFVHRMRPTFRSMIRSYCVLICMAILAAWVNSIIPGANYLYMARPESAPSVLDLLPPNYALRVSIIVAVITVMFALSYLPWYIKDKKAAKCETGAGV